MFIRLFGKISPKKNQQQTITSNDNKKSGEAMVANIENFLQFMIVMVMKLFNFIVTLSPSFFTFVLRLSPSWPVSHGKRKTKQNKQI